MEEKLQEVCEHLGISRDGHLNRKKLISICEQFGLQHIDGEVSGAGGCLSNKVYPRFQAYLLNPSNFLSRKKTLVQISLDMSLQSQKQLRAVSVLQAGSIKDSVLLKRGEKNVISHLKMP